MMPNPLMTNPPDQPVPEESLATASVDHALIHDLEDRAFAAWRPLRQMELGGWRLGCADGFTRRANSVYPLGQLPAEMDTAAAISACEQWYAAQGQPVCFKLTSASQPAALEALLEARGYERLPGALVMTADLQGGLMTDPTVTITSALTPAWVDLLCEMNPGQAAHAAVIQQMLSGEADTVERYFATVFQQGTPAAVGIAMREGETVGLFDIVTHPDFRRQGHARRMVQSLLALAAQSGARMAYLQVVEANEPAMMMYQSLGFKPVYQYWYRTVKLRLTDAEILC